ncbi:MAG TPA: SPOR domain-containing protein [Longimicrobiales bacterium]|nr:SPOR domain-containing protein [Longimicrobiales bacterium]
MSQSAWPDPATFDVDADALPATVAELVARPEEIPAAILLLAGWEARSTGWAGRTAVEIAVSMSAAGRQAVLVDLGFDEPELHTLLGGANLEGIADHFLFGASLGQVAVPAGGFRFVPPGAYAPDPEELIQHPRWAALIREAETAGQCLLLYTPAPGPGLAHLVSLCGAAIVLATESDRRDLEAAFPDGPRVVAVLAPPGSDVAAAGMETAEGAEDPMFGPVSAERWDEPGTEAVAADGASLEALIDEAQSAEGDAGAGAAAGGGRRGGRLFAALLILAVLAVAAWFGLRFRSGAQETAGAPAREGIDVATAGAVDPELPPETPEVGVGGSGEEGADSADVDESVAGPVPYSVAIEAHPDLAVAQRRVDALRAAVPDLQFYVAPVLVERAVYYRVLAGPTADASAAQALMRRLVAERHKRAEEAWAVRPTAMAFHLGDFDTREAASARERELRELGVPSYILEIPLRSGGTRFRLYAGAYQNAAEAEVLEQILRNAGIQARLIERVGRPAA